METFTALKELVDNPSFQEQRQRSLAHLDLETIDEPLVRIVSRLAKIPCCFTMQSCFGHFVYGSQRDIYNIEPLPATSIIELIEYRIAYIALCIESSASGRALFRDLADIPALDADYIQFGCAEWFWERQVNSYALQVEPKRQMMEDKITVGYQEALHIERVRNQFFEKLNGLLQIWSKGTDPG